MRHIAIGISVLLLAFAIAGCSNINGTSVATASAVAEFNDRLARRGHVTFRSWDGKRRRADNDTELAFDGHGGVQMLDGGLAEGYFTGKYHIHDGCVVAWFLGWYRGEWPAMVLGRDAKGLNLRPFNPYDPHLAEQMGGPPDSDLPDGYWPLRLLDGDEEQKILEEMKRAEQAEKPLRQEYLRRHPSTQS